MGDLFVQTLHEQSSDSHYIELGCKVDTFRPCLLKTAQKPSMESRDIKRLSGKKERELSASHIPIGWGPGPIYPNAM